jgi:catechol 2,3-dioxygenase-like lactoylglutathione lyase family enzyme
VSTNSAGFRFVEIGSGDIDRSLDFYRSMLDFTLVDQVPWPPHERVHWPAAGPVLVKLVDVGEGDLGGWVNEDLQRGMRHMGLELGDVDHRAERLRDAGGHFTIEPTDAVGDVRLAFFQDPDGTLLEILDGHLHYHTVLSPEHAERERAAAQRRSKEAAPIFDHVAATVSSLDETLTFYQEGLGYEVESPLSGPLVTDLDGVPLPVVTAR